MRDRRVLTPLIADLHDETWFFDRSLARLVTDHWRSIQGVQAVIVPSMAFPDDAEHWNLVVFLESVPSEPGQWVTNTTLVGPLQWN